MTSLGIAHDFGPRSNDSHFADLDEVREDRRREAIVPRLVVKSPPARQLLPFRVGIVETESGLEQVQALRQAAYGHHLPKLAATFGQPDPVDRWPDVTIFFAQDKVSGRVVGSARLQSNRTQPLQIERCTTLPPHLQDRLLAEVTRMSVMPGYAHPVKLALVKALHLFCISMQIGGIVAASRPSLMRQYSNLGFEDLYGDERMVPLTYAGGIDHRVLFRDTVTSEAHNRARNHPDYAFVFRTYHPDIEVFRPLDRASEPLRRAGSMPRYSLAA